MDYCDSIRTIYAQATDADRAAGTAWYRDAERIARAIADRTGIAPDRVAAAIAALSPRNPWRWNVADAAAFADAAARGDADRPSATTFSSNADRAWAFIRGETDWRTTALKVRSFVANILGDTDAVTVDVWAIRVATDGRQHTVRNDREYRAVADAYRTVAAEHGITPRELQAITWVTAERIGLGSKRRGRHGLTWKRGTLPWVPALLTAAA